MSAIRWLFCIPLGMVAVALVLQAGYLIALLFGGGTFFLWIPCGAGAAHVGFHVVKRVAPKITKTLGCLLSIALISSGSMATVGAFRSSEMPNLGLAYIAMVFVAVAYIIYIIRPSNPPPG